VLECQVYSGSGKKSGDSTKITAQMNAQIKKITQNFVLSCVLSFGVLLVFWAFDNFRIFNGAEDRLTDLKMLLRNEKVEDVPVVLIWVDDASVMNYGFRSPTPRKLLADLVQDLSNKGPKVIALDFLFDRDHMPEQDEALVSSLEQGLAPIIITSPELGENQNLEEHNRQNLMAALQHYPLVGFSEVKTGSGDIVRWLRVAKSEQESGSLVARIYSIFTGSDITATALPDTRLAPGWIRLNFWTEPSTLTSRTPAFQNFSALEVAYLPKQIFEDKIVLIGSGIADLGDTFLSPFSTRKNNNRALLGVEIHALALEMLLHQRFLHSLSATTLHTVLWGALLLIIVGALYLRPIVSVTVFLLVVSGWTMVSFYLFNRDGLMIPMVGPWLILSCTFVLAQAGAIFKGQKQSRFIRSTFKRYVSPEVVETLLKNPEELELGGELRPVTIIFTDIQGFTSISEKLSPARVVELLNEYLEVMNHPIFEQHGTLDKYIGDAIMAFYGAPLPQPDQADRACRTAILMQQALSDLNTKWQTHNIDPFRMRVGIHSANVVVGNIGSQTKMDYTVIGDGVNLAARLEAANKFFGTEILVSEDTLSQTRADFIARELGKIVVKGKSRSIRIFELCGEKGFEYCSLEEDIIKSYDTGLQYFYQQEFATAMKIFGQLSEQGDQSSEFIFNQCELLLKNPPDRGWDGAIILSTKG
jgi:class 3 adenylate cyclase/CHASE2 domain-containing sensor protein